VVAAAADFGAHHVVAEVNQGGDLVPLVVNQVAPGLAIETVRASRGKWVRAEPVASLYAEGRVAHVGRHTALEDEMLAFGAGGRAHGRSPDRVDALVWALTDLMSRPANEPGIRML
jgi:phage terminase large subunit-like protein